jgi:3',5'-nucleoside bisphosphate phosphatase
LIDLHLHTTASDGSLSPADLVARVAASGITVLSVTDHDTTGGLTEARAAATARGLTFVNGIEVTAVEGGRDVHVLGYFIDPAHAELRDFLVAQRDDRVRRIEEMTARLADLGYTIDPAPLLARAGGRDGRSVGRPHVADALIAAGHARDRNDAFDRLIGAGAPAFVSRRGPDASDVVAVIHAAGGLASMAHPGLTKRDDLIPRLVSSGLDALETRHSDHDAVSEAHYRALAATHGLASTGGSDFHGDESGHHRCGLGIVTLSQEDFAALQERLR